MKNLINEIKNDEVFRQRLENELGEIIDRELEKDENEIDFRLIEECSDALLFLSGEGYEERTAPPSILRKYKAKLLWKKSLKPMVTAAAAITLILLSYSALNVPPGKLDLPSTTAPSVSSDSGEDSTVTETQPVPETGEQETETQQMYGQKTEGRTTGSAESGKENVSPAEGQEATSSQKGLDEFGDEEGRPYGFSDENGYRGGVSSQNSDDEPADNDAVYGKGSNSDDFDAPSDGIIVLRGIFRSDFKTVYAEGEALDTSGLSVAAEYVDGSQRLVDISRCRISGFSSSTSGEKIVKVTYGDQSFTFRVIVR